MIIINAILYLSSAYYSILLFNQLFIIEILPYWFVARNIGNYRKYHIVFNFRFTGNMMSPSITENQENMIYTLRVFTKMLFFMQCFKQIFINYLNSQNIFSTTLWIVIKKFKSAHVKFTYPVHKFFILLKFLKYFDMLVGQPLDVRFFTPDNPLGFSNNLLVLYLLSPLIIDYWSCFHFFFMFSSASKFHII